jgi:hypothetical protein
MDVCVRLFCVCVVLCVGSCTATSWTPAQGALSIYLISSSTSLCWTLAAFSGS